MSESKVEMQQRKIRNGIRKEKEARERKMWDTLSSEAPVYRKTFSMGMFNNAVAIKDTE